MAYARMGENSDVYVYKGADFECAACILEPPFQTFKTRHGIQAHLENHLRAGHKVPASCLERLALEMIAERTGTPMPETPVEKAINKLVSGINAAPGEPIGCMRMTDEELRDCLLIYIDASARYRAFVDSAAHAYGASTVQRCLDLGLIVHEGVDMLRLTVAGKEWVARWSDPRPVPDEGEV